MLYVKLFDMQLFTPHARPRAAQGGRRAMQYAIGRELRSLHNLIFRYFERCSHKKEIDTVTGTNCWIIGYLSDHDDRDIFQKDLEEHFTITRSTASRVLRLMEQKGLIERQQVARDARLKKLVLTQKARQLSEMMKEDRQDMERRLLSGFSAEEVAALHAYLLRMKANMTACGRQAPPRA